MPCLLATIMNYKTELVDNRPQLFGVVIQAMPGPALATTNGQIIVGTEQDMRTVFGRLIVSLVPISPRTTVPLKNIRAHVENFFEE